MTAAPTTPVTCEREPACSATAVRDPLVLTGKPWKSPAAMLAAPMPIISWSPWTRSPRRAANDDAVDIVSASATTAMATAPRNSGGIVGPRHRRDRERREPLRQHADRRRRRASSQVEHVDQPATASTTATRTAGTFGRNRLQHQDARPATRCRATAAVRVDIAVGDAGHEARASRDQPVGVDREAEELGQLADDDRQRQAVHVADLGRLGEQVGDEARGGPGRPRP